MKKCKNNLSNMVEAYRSSQTILAMVCDAVVESVTVAGDAGAPAGHLYAAMMAHGVTLDQFTQIMSVLVDLGKLRKSGDLYFAVIGCGRYDKVRS